MPTQVDPTEPVHQVLNLAEFNERAVSLHIYSKPYDSCLIYSWPKTIARRFPCITRASTARCVKVKHCESDPMAHEAIGLALALAQSTPCSLRLTGSPFDTSPINELESQKLQASESTSDGIS